MNVKNIIKLLALAATSWMIAGCELEGPDSQSGEGTNPGSPDKAAYMSISIKPSFTSSPYSKATVTEAGSEGEQKIQNILMVLASSDNNYCLHALVNVEAGGKKATAEFGQDQIGIFYEGGSGALKDEYKSGVNVFVFCNPTQDLTDKMNSCVAGATDWVDAAYEIVNPKDDAVWTAGTFLMANSTKAVRQLPVDFNDWTENFSSADKAFNLSGANSGSVDNSLAQNGGPIKVERSVARLDFADKSAGKDNTYSIADGVAGDAGKDETFDLKVKLVEASLVNMSKGFYQLRRVSADAAATTPDILGDETDDNYIVDTDWQEKSAFATDKNYVAVRDNFHYPLFDADGKIDKTGWNTYRISDILDKDSDGDDYTGTGDYHVWRYIAENTIPGTENQLVGVSTGVMFTGKMVAGDNLAADAPLRQAIDGTYDYAETGDKADYIDEIDGKKYPLLFMFDDRLYVGWRAGVKESNDYKDNEMGGLHLAFDGLDDEYQKILDAATDDERNTAFTAFCEAAVKEGFTIYRATKDDVEGNGYYFHYHTVISHRNNGNATGLGPMEYAIVRNNIYKLAVTKISKLGFPEYTPDPLDPTDPDEKKELFITLEVQVDPWKVVENDFEL